MATTKNSEPKLHVVYVELLDEGVTCARPTLAEPLPNGEFRLLPTADYDPADEHWEFPPLTVVRCRKELWSGGEILIAREAVREPPTV